jgi:micrococcal nuclease
VISVSRVIVIALIGGLALTLGMPEEIGFELPESMNVESSFVARVIDGDTVVLQNGEVVRYLGVDAPETVDPKKPVECFGKEASDFNRKLTEGKQVVLVKDVSDKDTYGRLLRLVYLADGTLVDLLLIEQGYARAFIYPPDVMDADEFMAAESRAQSAGRGIWGVCPHPFSE